MKTFFLVKNHLKEKFLDNTSIISGEDKKNEIINLLKIKNINPNEYIIFDESEMPKKNKFFEKYVESILDVYFPTSWNAKTNGYVYYPAPKIVNSNKRITYVNRWEEFSESNINKLETIRYISDDSEKEEHRRVMILQFN